MTPVLDWVRLTSRRAVISDNKAVPYGGAPWDEFKERIDSLGGGAYGTWNTGQFASLELAQVLELKRRYGATHMLVLESDPKFLSAVAAGWTLVSEWAGSGDYATMRLFEIP
jgi:hypothetical protein